MELSKVELSKAQHDAITSRADKLLIVAGAGSGKTEVLARRIVSTITEEGEDESAIIAVTFTNKAGRELAERIQKIRPGTNLGYIGTIHGLCLRVLQWGGHVMGYRKGLAVINDEQSDEMLMRSAILCGHGQESLAKLRAVRDAMGTEILAGPSLAGPSLVTPAAVVVASYYKKLKSQNAVDFRGLLSEAARCLQAHNGADTGYRRLFVDEFQDTSKADMMVFLLVIPRDGTMCCVGDADQAIFAFRGGSVQNMLNFAARPNVEVLKLEENYRSDIAICEAAQALISHNKNRIEKRTVPVSDQYGVVEMMEPADNEAMEGNRIADRILAMIGNDGTLPEDIAVLARTNAIADKLRDLIRSRGIVTEDAGDPTLTRDLDWRISRAALELLAAPDNDLAALYWIQVKEGPETAEKYRQQAALSQQSIAGRYYMGFPPRITMLHELVPMLSQMGAMHSRLYSVIDNMPPDATVADIALATRWIAEDSVKKGLGVAVRTMHSAKGCEWPVVFLAAMEQEVIPGKTGRNEIEEERRLAYVAITRAMRMLIVSQSKARGVQFGQMKGALASTSPSVFTLEMLS